MTLCRKCEFIYSSLTCIWDHFCHFFAQNSLGDCVCQKVMQSARHTGTAQISSVLCVGVSEWNWIKRRGLLVEGQPRGKISPRAARKFSVAQISAHPWLLYSAIHWNRGRSFLPQTLEVQRDERWVPLVIDHVTLISFQGIMVNWRYWWEYNQKFTRKHHEYWYSRGFLAIHCFFVAYAFIDR